MPAAIDAALRKFHASLNASDLDRSVAFYRTLIGTEPARQRSDYAKFDIAEPRWCCRSFRPRSSMTSGICFAAAR